MDATDLDDALQTCPYEVSHRILKSRMQWHLVRCRRNHPCDKSQLKVCPYDVTHIINTLEYEYHINNCSKSGSVINFVQATEAQRSVGSVSLEEITSVYVPPSSENWDNDAPVPTYDALKEAQNKGVLLSEVGLSKAKRRQFKNSERMRIKALEESGIIHNPRPAPEQEQDDADKPLRPVNKASKSLSVVSELEVNDLMSTESPLRPPRSKSKAISVCSNIDYMEETCNSSLHLNTSTQSEISYSIDKTPTNMSSQQIDSQPCFELLLEETKNKTEQIISQSSNCAININNVALRGFDFDPVASNVARSSSVSSSNTLDNIDSNHLNSNSYTLNNEMIINSSKASIEEITSRLAALQTLEQNLVKEKEKLKEQMDNYFAGGSSRSK